MAEVVTNEMLLECVQNIQRSLDEMKVGLTSFQSELQAVNKEMSLFLQSRLSEEQPE